MDSLPLLDSSFSLHLVQLLGHFLWQGCLVAFLALVASWLLRRRSAQSRYLLNLVALVSMLLCLPVTSLVMQFGGGPTYNGIVFEPVPSSVAQGAKPQASFGPSASPGAVSEPLDAPMSQRQSVPGVASVGQQRPSGSSSSGWSWHVWAPCLTLAYFSGVGLMLVRLAFGLAAGYRFRRYLLSVEEPALLEILARQARVLGLRFVPAVAYCERVAVPVLIGVLRPMILLPISLAGNLAPQEIEAILTHELAHLRRYDPLVNFLQRIVEAVLFFHPAVWYVSRQVRLQREHCCDDMVVAAGEKTLAYVQSLVRMAELSVPRSRQKLPRWAGSVNSTGDHPSQLRGRILRLLGDVEDSRVRLTRSGALAFAAVLLALSLLGLATIRAAVPTAAAPDTSAADAINTQQRNPRKNAPAKPSTSRGTNEKAGPLLWINFVGNTIANNDRLRTHIKSRVGILGGDIDPEQIEEDKKRLTAYYRNLGFFDVKVGREWNTSADGKRMGLTFTIHEGPRYVVHSVAFRGNGRFSSDQLAEALKLQKGDFYDSRKMQQDVAVLRDTYGAAGYVFAKVHPDLTLLEKPGQIELAYRIQEGDRCRVGQIEAQIVGGNPHTNTATVLNQLSLRPGDIVDIRKLRANEQQLKTSGLFVADPAKGKSPKITLIPPTVEDIAKRIQEGTVKSTSTDGTRDENRDNRAIDVPIQLTIEVEFAERATKPQSVSGQVVGKPSLGTIEGRLVDEKDQPLVGVSVVGRIPSSKSDALPSGQTKEDGRFTLYNVPEGVKIENIAFTTFSDAMRQSSRAIVLQTQPLLLRLERSLVMEGTVVDPEGNPVPDATVTSVRGDRPWDPRGVSPEQPSTQTDPHGHFVLTGFPASSFQLLLITHAQRKLAGWVKVEAPNADPHKPTISVKVPLEQAGRAAGRVLVDGRPLAGVEVPLVALPHEDDFTLGRGVLATTVTTDSAGSYVFENLAPGLGMTVRFVRESGKTFTRSFAPKPGETVELESLYLQRHPKSIAGIVIDPQGKPVPEAEIQVRMRDESLGEIPYNYTHTVEKDGRFRVNLLPDVPLRVTALIRPPANAPNYRILASATVDAAPGDENVRIVLDAKWPLQVPEDIERGMQMDRVQPRRRR